MNTCFMCNKPTTTKDHIPPLCFFPEQKDIPKGANYRKNLITVPACDEHNSKTSMDDEYLLGVVSFHWRNNQVGSEYSISKIKRALTRRKRYYDLFFGEGRHQFLFWQGEQLVTGTVDINRFKRSMDKIARGIYSHHFQRKWLGEVNIHPYSLTAIYNEPNPILTTISQVAQAARLMCVIERRYGDNPDVFYYQYLQDTPDSATIMRLVFYGGFEVMAFLNPEIPE